MQASSFPADLTHPTINQATHQATTKQPAGSTLTAPCWACPGPRWGGAGRPAARARCTPRRPGWRACAVGGGDGGTVAVVFEEKQGDSEGRGVRGNAGCSTNNQQTSARAGRDLARVAAPLLLTVPHPRRQEPVQLRGAQAVHEVGRWGAAVSGDTQKNESKTESEALCRGHEGASVTAGAMHHHPRVLLLLPLVQHAAAKGRTRRASA